jgi:hypothetical protein
MTQYLEARARRAAKRVGLVATKSRWRKDSLDNFGDFQLRDPNRNAVVGGSRYDLTAQQVIDWCTDPE